MYPISGILSARCTSLDICSFPKAKSFLKMSAIADSIPHPTSPQAITSKVKEILKSSRIDNEVSEVLMNNAELKGENFASDTCCVTVKFSNPTLKPQNFFVKVLTSSESQKELLEKGKFFEKEALFFMKYIPAVQDFLKSKGQENLLRIYPKCYYADTQLVILEHLVLDRGFELLDKNEMHNFETATLALDTLAKHHAISYAYTKEVGGVSQLVKKFPYIDFEAFNHIRNPWELILEGSIRTCIQILKKSSAEGKEEAISALEAREVRLWDYLMNARRPDPDNPWLLLNHGDYWTNNMLFKRNKETKALVEQVAIDFQIIRIDSPGADLSSYLFSSVDIGVRQTRLKEMLSAYLDTLNEITEKLGHPIGLTYEELFNNYRQRLEFSFWFFGVWIATRATYSALEEFTSANSSEWADVYLQSVQKWVDANPDKWEEDAVHIVRLMKEYRALSFA